MGEREANGRSYVNRTNIYNYVDGANYVTIKI